MAFRRPPRIQAGCYVGMNRYYLRPLWQDSYHDHILRDDEAMMSVAAYTLANPVRAGLVRHPLEWRYLGSGRYKVRELLETLGSGPEGPHHT